jgi:PqqD family protein of HPr-rel-A system
VSAAIRKAADKFSETAIDDEVVVMSLASGDFFSLTGTARAIWLLIDGTRDRDALIAALAAEYDIPAEAVGGDVDAFLADLDQAGLLARG